MQIEILDTTLRDGEQTSGVSFASSEKLHIARFLLGELHVDRLEVASAKVSEGEYETVKRITRWATANGFLDRIEILGFVDGDISLNWIHNAGGKVMNLLCKGSLKHCKEQLHKTPEQHLADIKTVLQKADAMGISVNIYLEDWSNGMLHSRDYVFYLMDNLKDTTIKRFMLPDTLGILNPINTGEFCRDMRTKYPDIHFDFHAHNDYDLAVGNVFAAVQAGISGIHTTINGLGERAGNAPLASVIAVLHDQLQVKTNTIEKSLNPASRLVESYSGIRIANNKPLIGDNVFTQCAGVHADGDNKNNLYYNDLLPERFGRYREYALGKNSGKSNIKKNLEAMGIEVDDATMKKITERIIELGDKKEIVTQEDLPYIISDMLHLENNDKIRMVNYSLSLTQGLRPTATVRISIDGKEYEQTAPGDGQYHAFSKAVWKIYNDLGKPTPELTDYNVSIPAGGQTDALVQTTIAWKFNGKDFKTRGLDVDQTEAAIKATVKMLNRIENR
ncbi:MAG: 2-isopropylmalate synthase [Candidatus Ordinivivax streblomastigis]|uniref:2-isopropylmalate synthase n=1 Tax=Candidatus Ordinivivax streblomastigis TaxID=2540710 RepID=A0A5M8P2H9_9BACT|nr:MAG: 2-isopropylmalate synthase [Candidatus Ordinivivax streblomastigis]